MQAMQQEQGVVVRLPLDGGYGWMVTVSAFMVGFILDGISFSFGLFYNEFLEYFQESKAKTAWIGSVYNGMYMTIGPIVSFMCDKYGCRRVSMAGGVLACVSCLCAVFANSVSLLILTYGFMGGFGFGMMYLPALVMVGQYFDKRRALATGIAVCGSGVGGFVFAYLTEFLIDTFTWRGATLILGGIALNGTVFGALLRPLEVTVQILDKTATHTDDGQGLTTSLLSPNFTADQLPDGPRAKDKTKKNTSCEEFYLSLPDCSVIASSAAMVKHPRHDVSETKVAATAIKAAGSQPLLCATVENGLPHYQTHRRPRMRQLKIDIARPKFNAVSSPSLNALREEIAKRETEASSAVEAAEQKHNRIEGTQQDREAAKERLRRLGTEALKSLRILRGNPALLVYGAACFLCMAGFFIPFTYIPVYARSLSLHPSAPQDLISVIGWVNLVSRLLVGWVGDHRWADCILINSLSLVLGGVGTGLFVLYKSFSLLVMACVIFGSCIAIFVALRSVIGVELVGVDNLSEAFGIIILCQGLSTFVGTPLAGFLADLTGDVVSTFYFAGGAILLSGLLCLPLRRVSAWKSDNTGASAKESKELSST